MAESSEERNAKFVKNWLETTDIELVADTIKEWLDEHPEARDDIVREHQLCPEIMMARLRKRKLSFSHPPPNVPVEAEVLKRKSSITENLSVDDLKRLDKNEMFMELLRNIVSPEFNVNSISYKILLNVLILTNADRSSLFLVEGTEDSLMLVSRLFDVSENSTLESSLHAEAEAIKIPINNKSIVGTVASTGKPLILNDAYSDPRFNTNVDKLTGYKTNSILCMPITASNGQLLGVAQVINKKGVPGYFVEEDLEVAKLYLNFCGIALVNTQLFNNCFNLSNRLEVLLQTAGELFYDTTSLKKMLENIVVQAQKLIACRRVELLLVDEDSTTLTDPEEIKFKTIFCYENNRLITLEAGEIGRHECLSALQVAKSGKVVISVGPKSEVTGAVSSSLTVPICRKTDVIGVLKVIDKENGLLFNSDDRDSLMVFCAFCGLGIHNVMNYETILKISARQTVALEMLSYHASASEEDTLRLMNAELPSSESLQLANFRFDDQWFSDDETVLGAVRMFVDCDFVNKFRIDSKVLYRWVLTVKKNYRSVIYHNWRHAYNVAQTMFSMFKVGKLEDKFTDLEQLAMIVGCLCHDLDHRGTNNAFQRKAESPLAFLYSTSTMEHHHFDHCIMILNSTGNNIFNGLNPEEYKTVIHLLETAILSTDLATFLQKRKEFFAHVQNNTLDWSSEENRELTRGMFMTACDVAAISKPWDIQHRVAKLVASEFFEQGDEERTKLKIEPCRMMDRNKKDELPDMQVGFISFVCVPLYKNLALMTDNLRPLFDGTVSNMNRWKTMIIKKDEKPDTDKKPADTETRTDTEKPADSETQADTKKPADQADTEKPADSETQADTDKPADSETQADTVRPADSETRTDTEKPADSETRADTVRPETQADTKRPADIDTRPDTATSVILRSATPVDSSSPVTLTPVPVVEESITLSPVHAPKPDAQMTLSPARTVKTPKPDASARTVKSAKPVVSRTLSSARTVKTAKADSPSSARTVKTAKAGASASARTTKSPSPQSAKSDKPLKAGATKRGITPRALSDAQPVVGWKSSDKKASTKSQEKPKTSQKRKCKSAV